MISRKRSNSDKSAILNRHRQPKQINQSVADKTAPPEKIFYSVAHAIPGRIRFRIPRLAVDSDYANKLKLVMQSDSKTTSVRVNPQAASIVINYQRGASDDKMRSHLVNLIQNAPNIVVPTKPSAKSIAQVIFDALINLIDSTRNINQARNAIMHKRFRKDTWERLLSGAKTTINGLKSAIMFILPNKRSQNSDRLSGLQSFKMPAVEKTEAV
ncbi:MAG: HMA2 domain-containing protein [Heteroscytonema crispum UTEX LB 1556]